MNKWKRSNPHRIVPAGPVIDFMEPHGRDRIAA